MQSIQHTRVSLTSKRDFLCCSSKSALPKTVIPQLRDLSIAAGLCGVASVIGWLFYIYAFHRLLGQDWMVFYTAARSYLDGNLTLVLHGRAFTEALVLRFVGWLHAPINLHPWVYPPSFLLLFMPLGLLPAPASFALFSLGGFVASLIAICFYKPCGGGRWILISTLFLCPAVPFDIVTGQNALYTSALLFGGFALLGRAPALAGALLGIMTFKPQLCLMVPVALVAARQWRALSGAAAIVIALPAASAVVFGIPLWRAWLDMATGHSALYQSWVHAGRIAGTSVFAYASWLGASSKEANLIQATAIVMAAGFVYWLFAQRAPRDLQLSGLFVATLFAAPHASDQDGILLGLAASLYLLGLPQRGYHSIYTILAALVWLSPLINPPAFFRIALITPVLLVFFIALIAAAVRQNSGSARLIC